MAKGYKYFNRDISWLSYDRLVLESAEAEDISIGEALNFVSFHSSNLDEFYGVRMADYRRAVREGIHLEEVTHPAAMIQRINMIVSSQMHEASDIISTTICDRLFAHGIKFHFGEIPTDSRHIEFMHNYFEREVVPNIQPVLLDKGTLVFLRDNRPYFVTRLFKKGKHRENCSARRRACYSVVKLPIIELPRFVLLPDIGDGLKHIVFLDDIIRANIGELYPGYTVEGAWGIKVRRDANLQIDEDEGTDIAEAIRDNLVMRKTGAPSGFYHDRLIPHDVLSCLKKNYGFAESEMVSCGRYLNLHDIAELPVEKGFSSIRRSQVVPRKLQICASLFDVINSGDFLLHYPYQPFDYVIRLLNEAAKDPKVTEIKVTQYRVATNSAVVNSLISAATAGKRVTVFVELKARFDEKNNLEMSDRMKAAGIKIIYSIPGLKVHAKAALVIRGAAGSESVAYISTGNFNEQTAKVYTDHGYFTADKDVTNDLMLVFKCLESSQTPHFVEWKEIKARRKPELKKLLVSQFNMEEKLHELIRQEIKITENGGVGRITLKMNGLQYRPLINDLYEASMAGVKVTVIVRGICCLVPGQEYSRNIDLVRLVDNYLEHGRIWAFGLDGCRGVYISSSDWQNRNIRRRIEVAVPIANSALRQELMQIMDTIASDNSKAHTIDQNLNNIKKTRKADEKEIRAQRDIYDIIGQWQ